MRNKPHSNKFKRLRTIAKAFVEKELGSGFKPNYKRLKKMYNEKSRQSNAT